MAEIERNIVIRPVPFGSGFDVTVQPPVEGEAHDREFPTHRQAFGYAGGLRLVRRWTVVDLASDAHPQNIMGGAK